MKYVAYFRVSTQRQGQSGLGLEGQQAAVAAFCEPLESFTEVESGKRSDRPELARAIAACKRLGATLVIAKLDRLARNVHFVSGLMESGVEFIACDNPNANRLTVHILAAVAEDEARRISERTKAALAAARLVGFGWATLIISILRRATQGTWPLLSSTGQKCSQLLGNSARQVARLLRLARF